ncbi:MULTISPECIES: ABC transporter substrate-binding protein [Brenneria]|uniref:ABC transporter substrate-binding protein n=1 Tax=Brenneria nigrifluens DSM 30175 = ATCC 13028 TaxID=1121120 RepID=A0A2U1UM36_9GAMM|nr:ABC-type transporter, periplasmic subunit [Brenneria sp. EniD312]PWC22687.1 ABC transporter substrate-binding protein [Brenneria nigrifluens DSM 30175 = ATCC 13028]QCR03816.1 ABC transporter substrate-binding protein [Brenneria nigrifluens DSM 30175 = ATCC 13028]
MSYKTNRHSPRFARLTAAAALAACAWAPFSASAGTLSIAMTAADIPLTLGQPDQGYEGNRFTGITLYDALVLWDLSQGEKPSELVPGLATEWHVDPQDHTKWIFKLRPEVKFHDGTAFNADAVVWNVDKVLNKEAPQYAPAQIGNTASRMPTLRSARKIDDLTVELTTSEPDSILPFNLTNLFIVSPAAWQKDFDAVPAAVTDAAERAKQAWAAFAFHAVGTGPFKMNKLVPRQQLTLDKNPAYWDPKRIPQVDQVLLIPLPEANARTAALLSGQVDWIEAPAPDAMAQIESRGFKIYANSQPHIWPWQLSFAPGSPWLDKRVRQAANLCLNRSELKSYLGGYMQEASGTYEPGSPWYGNPSFKIRYDEDAARKLMSDAGFSAGKPVKVKVLTSASGSGQMQPLPMNEYIQQSLKNCYFDVNIVVTEWNTLFSSWRLGAKDPAAQGADAINVSAAVMDPFFGMMRFASEKTFPPVSTNWGYFTTPKIEALIEKARNTFEPKALDAAAAELHQEMVDETPFLYVAHDMAPRAISPAVSGVVQAQSWMIDLTSVAKKN